MRAIILAAGLGSRLRPLTDNIPKAMVHFKGMPLVERIIRNLADEGIGEIMVNVHHYAGMLTDFIDRLEVPGTKIFISDESAKLMDTGGALLKARDFLSKEESFLVHNVDVITNLEIGSLVRQHEKDDSLATLAVKKRNTSRSLLFDGSDCLAGWRHNETGEEKMVRPVAGRVEEYGNSCIQVIRREFFDFFPGNEARNLTEMYLELAGTNVIRSFVHNRDYWYDLGTYSKFLNADREVF